jgi:hypothetical protein
LKSFKARRININELCDLERSQKDKVYDAGTCYVQMSAVSNIKKIWHVLEHDSTVTAGKYMMFLPNDGQRYDYEYMMLMLEIEIPKFLARYVTTLNIQAEAFNHLTILWIDDDNERHQYTRFLTTYQALIDSEIKLNDSINMFKKVMLDYMFV